MDNNKEILTEVSTHISETINAENTEIVGLLTLFFSQSGFVFYPSEDGMEFMINSSLFDDKTSVSFQIIEEFCKEKINFDINQDTEDTEDVDGIIIFHINFSEEINSKNLLNLAFKINSNLFMQIQAAEMGLTKEEYTDFVYNED